MNTILKVLATPIIFVLTYALWVCIIGGFIALITWDLSVITNNVFPWNGPINIGLRSIAGILSIFSVVTFWEEF